MGEGYCPECGKQSKVLEFRSYDIGFAMWILECVKCGKWEIQAK